MIHPVPILRPRYHCPFCGAHSLKCHAEEVDQDRWSVICESCGANGPICQESNTPGRALLFWDGRAEPPLAGPDLSADVVLKQG